MTFPLIDIKSLQKWVDKNPIVKGVSPRWLIPTRVGNIDTILIVIDVKKEKEIGMIDENQIPSLDGKEIVMEELLMHKLGYSVGDVVSINFKPKNFPNGLKLF